MPDPETGVARSHALGIGNAVHAALEWSAARDWRAPDGELSRGCWRARASPATPSALSRARRPGRRLARIRAARASSAGAPVAEVPFVLALAETVVRGKIDLLVEDGGVPTVVDYKTDALDGRSPADSPRATRRSARSTHSRSAAIPAPARVHVFLEAPDEPQIEVFDADDLRAASGAPRAD